MSKFSIWYAWALKYCWPFLVLSTCSAWLLSASLWDPVVHVDATLNTNVLKGVILPSWFMATYNNFYNDDDNNNPSHEAMMLAVMNAIFAIAERSLKNSGLKQGLNLLRRDTGATL